MTNNSYNNNNNNNKNVSFGNITIHQHPLQLGDNPACSSGAPLTIGWNAESTHTRCLEVYEVIRGPRRHGRQLAIPLQDRARILLQAGYSLDEIGSATLEVESTKKRRADSLKGSPLERAGAILEKTGKLPFGLLKLMKPTRNTVQARSA